MDFLLEALTNWLKEMLVGGIMSNLSGMFDSVNQQVADISVQVGQTPQGWNGSIFSMIENLSNSIMVPIAGVILAIVMTVDLIQMIADKNNLHDVDTWMIFKWVFKSAAAILIVTNTWNIVMGVFDMGSTQKMGAGTNVQDRLIALHDLDCPWRPSNLAQRLGRIVRQGNMNPQVEIFRYVTEGTFDAYLYQLVENKQKFIAQIMTSKAPVRVADDVDETALSYSEIKALATGNPLIIEKCNLDMEVGKLNMLKASYLSQKYALEDMVLKKYPEAVTRLEERIAGYEQDVQLAAAHPKPQEGFVGITILDQPYADKEAAGKEILDVCTKMTGSDAVFLGQYRGFSLVLSYDGPSNEYRMTMKGTLSHTAVLGADVFGNLTRMDNVIDGLPGKLEAVRAELAGTQVQLENARTELTAPFAREAELAEKTARLKELNILLNMDQKDNSLIDDVPDEDTPEKSKVRDHER